MTRVIAMIEDIELITLISGLGVFLIIIVDRRMFTLLPSPRLLVSAYGCFLTGWVMTVVESLVFPETLNFIEHAMYASGSILLSIWCFNTFIKKQDAH